MNFFKKIHELFRQKELIVKKSQKHDANLQKNSTLYFQVGLIICLLATNALFEMYFETTIPDDPIVYQIPEDAIYIVPPVIEKKPVAMTKPEPKPDFKPQRLVEPPVVVPDDTNLKKEDPQPVIPEPPIKAPPVKPAPPKPPVKTIVHNNEVDQVPVFPGCEGLNTNTERIKCLSNKLTKHVQRKFDTNIAEEKGLNGKQTIRVRFTIDQTGNVTDIKAISKHAALEKEAKRVIAKVPQMKPGIEENKIVSVIYDLPIIFQVQY